MIPQDSVLNLWLKSLNITEVPISYQVLIGLSSIGALLKRSVYVDQVEWRVYPNLSVLLVGPSGIGKDVVINKGAKLVDSISPELHLGGTTIEFIKDELCKRPDPAVGYVPVQEFGAFLGGKDYQKGIAKELTDLLSTGERVVIGTKSESRRVIIRPTLTIQGGSTVEWLAELPDGSLSGGFLPRFVIVCEEYGRKQIAWVKYDNDYETREGAIKANAKFVEAVRELVGRFSTDQIREHEREMTPTQEAIDYYRNWYYNRFGYFLPSAKAYANRSRDQMHRLAMLMAVTRFHGYLEVVDYEFAARIMAYVGKGIDSVVMPMLVAGRRRR